MSNPTIIDLPHRLGRDEARRRIRSRVGELAGHIPGGAAQVETSWTGEDVLAIKIGAMGQQVSGTVEVQEQIVRLNIALPKMLSFMSGAIEAAVRSKGSQLLLGSDGPPADATPRA